MLVSAGANQLTYNTETQIMVLTTGIYKVFYSFVYFLGARVSIKTAIEVNGVPKIANTKSISNSAASTAYFTQSDEGIYSLSAGNAISVALWNVTGSGTASLTYATINVVQLK